MCLFKQLSLCLTVIAADMFLVIKSIQSLTEWQTWRRLDGSEASSRHKHASKGIPREGVFCKYQWENSNVNLSESSQQREVWERENRRGLWSDTHWLPGVTPLVWSKLNKKTHWLWIRADDLCKRNLLLCDAMKTTESILRTDVTTMTSPTGLWLQI